MTSSTTPELSEQSPGALVIEEERLLFIVIFINFYG